ncbi:FAD-dependent oxidoreductase [Xanthobacter autotrophicus DSM 431]|uniref:FAD-dependent oxidoreductase n=1 Tax=Xanthobacter nonsaccharivorans TaxID=3119912 RepID=UPI00372BC237
MSTYTYPKFAYRISAEQEAGRLARHPVVVIGAGPVGLTAALDFARRGIPTVVLDDNDTVSVGSRAVCYAKRPLEIWDRLGCGERMVQKGISWRIGKVFFEEDLRYQFDLLPEPDHKMPAMINLQQYYLEEYMVEACAAEPLVDLRWKHKLISLQQNEDFATLVVETPDGVFTLEAQWVVACDGAHSDTRKMVGADFSGQAFMDRFLIADVVMKAHFPTERWFWFDPPFHRNQSVLLHRQSDDVWRIDFQLGWDADPAEEKKAENIIPRVQAMLGPEAQFELEWASVYQFACRRIDNFRHGRVIFAGDSAHQVSPFGARGANSGVQDVDNLGWKLKLVLDGEAPESLLDTYHDERALAADDNIANSTRSTDFITPKNAMSRRFRNAVLELAGEHPFARPLVNSGRLSTPTPYLNSPLNTPDEDAFAGLMAPGTACADAPVRVDGRDGWFLGLLGSGFAVVTFGAAPVAEVACGGIRAGVLGIGPEVEDVKGRLAERYDGREGTTYLIRPDQHVAARWRSFDAAKIQGAIKRAVAA